MRSAYLRDPDGNLIELTGDLPRDDWSPELREAAEKYKQAG
jgi:catechol-2,3-dioxygenase